MHIVRLDRTKLPSGENLAPAYNIAESLICICGFIQVWEEPIHGHRLFFVKEVPQDVPQAGIFWIQTDVPRNPYKSLFEIEEGVH